MSVCIQHYNMHTFINNILYTNAFNAIKLFLIYIILFYPSEHYLGGSGSIFDSDFEAAGTLGFKGGGGSGAPPPMAS